MTKVLILLLDGAITVFIIWFVVLRDVPSEVWYLAGLSLIGFAVWLTATQFKKHSAKKERLKIEVAEAAKREEASAAEKARREIVAREHEARRHVCAGCRQKTEGIYQYRRVDGGPDRRYHHNPLLCNRCFGPYRPVRPWNLPNDEPVQHQQPNK